MGRGRQRGPGFPRVAPGRGSSRQMRAVPRGGGLATASAAGPVAPDVRRHGHPGARRTHLPGTPCGARCRTADGPCQPAGGLPLPHDSPAPGRPLAGGTTRPLVAGAGSRRDSATEKRDHGARRPPSHVPRLPSRRAARDAPALRAAEFVRARLSRSSHLSGRPGQGGRFLPHAAHPQNTSMPGDPGNRACTRPRGSEPGGGCPGGTRGPVTTPAVPRPHVCQMTVGPAPKRPVTTPASPNGCVVLATQRPPPASRGSP